MHKRGFDIDAARNDYLYSAAHTGVTVDSLKDAVIHDVDPQKYMKQRARNRGLEDPDRSIDSYDQEQSRHEWAMRDLKPNYNPVGEAFF